MTQFGVAMKVVKYLKINKKYNNFFLIYTTFKIFLINLKKSDKRYFAMKVTSKQDEMDQNMQKECGKLGSQCRFIVETVATFQNQLNDYILIPLYQHFLQLVTPLQEF